MDEKQPITGYLFRFSPNPHESGFYELSSSFACWDPQRQHVPRLHSPSSKHQDTCEDLDSNWSSEVKALFLQPSQNNTGNVKLLKGRIFQISSANPTVCKKLSSLFLQTQVFSNIFICISVPFSLPASQYFRYQI